MQERGQCGQRDCRPILQVNTLAAEVLYTVIRDWAQLDTESTVLDICCGTGTIGLALAPVSSPSPLRTPSSYPTHVVTCLMTTPSDPPPLPQPCPDPLSLQHLLPFLSLRQWGWGGVP